MNPVLTDLLSRDQKDFVASLLDALLGAGDSDVGAGVVGSWNSDLGGGLQLQLLQLLPVLADDKTVVLFGDGDRSRRLGEKEKCEFAPLRGETEIKARSQQDVLDHFCQLLEIQSNTKDVNAEDGINKKNTLLEASSNCNANNYIQPLQSILSYKPKHKKTNPKYLTNQT